MAGSFQDKVALVTGGASGMGRATVLAFAREGAKVVIGDIDAQGGEATAASIIQAGGIATFVAADVSKPADVANLVDASVKAHGRIDCAFNNAGIGGGLKPLHEWTDEEFTRVIAINLTGVWLCMKYELPAMIKTGGGAIVNNASVAGLRGSPKLAPYVASKHGVLGLTKVAALEYIRQGVRVNAVCPGWTETAIIHDLQEDPELLQRLIKRVPIGRLGQPKEIASAVLWLCSDASSLAVGHVMVLDGGLTA
jgi:NAD(P)-dependent dehydrogenase (short-subunit alcohol dehydrogenase family)